MLPPWRARLLAAAIFGVALVVAIGVSKVNVPAFQEMGRLAAVARAERIVIQVAERGHGDPVTKEALHSLRGQPGLLVLLGAWSVLSIGRVGLLDTLTAARLPWIALGALTPFLVFEILRPTCGTRVALIAATVLVTASGWIHAASVPSESSTAAACWLLVLFTYVRSLDARRRACWPLACGVAFGFGLACTPATLWIALLVTLHYAVLEGGSTRRLMRRGRWPVPTALVAMALLGPILAVVLDPGLWGASSTTVARSFLAPLAAPPLAELRDVRAVPGYAAEWLVWTLPLAAVALAALGTFAVFRGRLSRRFATGRCRSSRDRRACGALAVIGLGAAVTGPAIVPPVLSVVPPRVEAALPFVAMLVAFGLDRLAAAAGGPRRALGAVAIVVAGLAWLGLRSPSTGSVAYVPWLGGARSALTRGELPSGDGSELGAVVAAIDALGEAEVTVRAPDVPADYWEELRSLGRIATRVRPVTSASRARLELVRGTMPGDSVVCAVRREGAVLWTLARRRGR